MEGTYALWVLRLHWPTNYRGNMQSVCCRVGLRFSELFDMASIIFSKTVSLHLNGNFMVKEVPIFIQEIKYEGLFMEYSSLEIVQFFDCCHTVTTIWQAFNVTEIFTYSTKYPPIRKKINPSFPP